VTAATKPLSARSNSALRGWLLTSKPANRTQARLGRYYRNWLAFRRNPLAMAGGLIVVALIAMAILAPLFARESLVTSQNLQDRLLPMSFAHPFGTDELGRDVLVRVIYGSRITLSIVMMVAAIVLPIGLLIGTVAGYFLGPVDAVLMRLTDIFLAFPRLVLALAFVAALGPGIQNAVIAIALTSWPPYARLARAETLALRHADYVIAARLQGASAVRILWEQIVPLCLSSVVIRLTLDMSGIILTAAGLGFLGLGAQPPSPEWGAMVASGRQVLLSQWWVATMPGLAIFLVSLGFNLLGDGLRDVFDPHSS
jgi:peptide/nickel transport system permease protein